MLVSGGAAEDNFAIRRPIKTTAADRKREMRYGGNGGGVITRNRKRQRAKIAEQSRVWHTAKRKKQ